MVTNAKNFGLIGVGSDLQFGKAGTRLLNDTGTFKFKASNGTTDVALTAAGITSSSGNITLTTGNLVLSSAIGSLSIGGDASLSRPQVGVFQFSGDKALIPPVGNTAARPGTPLTGMIRVNNDTPAASIIEYFNGTSWVSLGSSSLTTEVRAIETSLGSMINYSSGTWNSSALNNATIWPVAPTDLTVAINTLATYVENNAGTGAGLVKAYQAVVLLSVDGTTNIGSPLPAGSTILSVKAIINTVDSTAIMTVGKTGNITSYMIAEENNPQVLGIYMSECFVFESLSTQVIATVSGSAGSVGASCNVIIEYQLAQ